MALTNEEIVRIKYELGYNVTGIGAEPYITYVALFDRAVQPYLVDAATTSSTSVTAADGGALATLTLASNPSSTSATQATAFVQGSSIVVDVGVAQETSIIQSISGLVITCNLSLAHSGTYPVRLQGAEQIVRDIFARLDRIKSELLNVAPLTAGLSALVGEVEFFSSGRNNLRGGRSKFEDLIFQRTVARRDLAAALGVPYLAEMRNAGANSSFEVY